MTRTRIAAIIPVSTLDGAKTRLGEALDAEERRDLVDSFLARTVVAALAVDRLDDVLVVSPDREVLRRAAELGARTLRQRSRGLNAGLREARTDVVAGGAEAILILPIDLPFVSPDSLAPVVESLAQPARPIGGTADSATDPDQPSDADRATDTEPNPSDPAVILVPDRHGTGTNVLALRPPTAIEFAFGRDSRRVHRAAAESAGATYIELGGPLTIDLDTADDLVFVESSKSEGLGVG
jgi:2-phospho-L-lactate/phosphoenolpyruvate guanylyltransferase